jgi:small GTP-binding protein
MPFLIKIIIIGDPGVGKTSLVKQFISEKFSKDYRITIGTNIFTKKLILTTGETIKMQLWDIAGQERWVKMRHLYYSGAHGVMMVADLTRRKTFEQLAKFWRQDLIDHCENAPIILIANKNDLIHQIKKKEIEIIRYNIGASCFFNTSAKDGTNVNKSFEILANEIVKNKLKGI